MNRTKDGCCTGGSRTGYFDGAEAPRNWYPLPTLRDRAVSCFCLAGGIYSIFALKRVARMGGRKPTFLLGRLECNDTGIARGVFGWIWKKFGKPPSAWRGRKGLKSMMLSGRWGSSA